MIKYMGVGGDCFLFRYAVAHLLMATVLTITIGCRQDDALAELRNENPFTSASNQAQEVLIVTCSCSSIQVSGHVDVASLLEGSGRSAPAEIDPTTHISTPIEPAFPAAMLKLWRQNGLRAWILTMSRWSEIWQSLSQLTATALPQRTALVRNAAEIAEFPMLWLDEPAFLFVTGPKNTLRGYTLEAGDFVFRVNCVPADENPANRDMLVKIVPTFRSGYEQEKFERDIRGRFHRVVETPAIEFVELTLQGRLNADQFLCIAVDQLNEPRGLLGNLFLSRDDGAENYQVVAILKPMVQTATEVKEQRLLR